MRGAGDKGTAGELNGYLSAYLLEHPHLPPPVEPVAHSLADLI